MPGTSGFDFSGMAAGMGANANNSGNGIVAQVPNAPAPDGRDYPDFVAHDAATGKFWGSMSKGDYDAWLLEQQSAREARDYTARREDTAMQRKVIDYMRAGFSPLAALEGSTGGQAQSAQVARAASHPSSGGFADKIIPALIMAFGAIASKGLSSASSAANAQELEAVKQANRLAVEKMRATAAMERIAVKAEDARSLAEMREAGNMARAEMRAQSARESLDLRQAQLESQRDIAEARIVAKDKAGYAWKENASDRAEKYRSGKKTRAAERDYYTDEEVDAALRKAFGGR